MKLGSLREGERAIGGAWQQSSEENIWMCILMLRNLGQLNIYILGYNPTLNECQLYSLTHL